MRINRQELLQRLESVQAGLATREVLEQSSCFIFRDEAVTTFNDRILCTQACPLEIVGAVAAAPLIAMLSKFPDDEVEIKPAEGVLVVRGSHRKAEIRMEADILLPMDSVDKPDKWRPVHEDFAEALEIVGSCVSKDEQKFILTCIHVHPNHLEACDNIQAVRFPIPTGVARPTTVPRDAFKHVIGLGMTEMGETKTWIHFRNPSGLMLSIRRYTDEYPPLEDALLLAESTSATLPGSLEEIIDRAEVFSSENAEQNEVKVELKADRLRITGAGTSGQFQETRQIKYEGEPIAFMISPRILTEISKRHSEVEIGKEKLRVDTGRFVYISCLGEA